MTLVMYAAMSGMALATSVRQSLPPRIPLWGAETMLVKTSHAAQFMIINFDITSHSLTLVSHRVLGSENTSEAPDRYKLATHVRHGDRLSQHLFAFAGWCSSAVTGETIKALASLM
jgi:hypothetical protein